MTLTVALVAVAFIILIVAIIYAQNRLEKRKRAKKIAKGLGAEHVGELKAKSGYFGALETAINRPIPPAILLADEDLRVKLEDALRVAGLPTNPREIIGRRFCFEAKVPKTANHITLIGTITGIEISNIDQGVNVYLSTRQFHGLKVERLHIEYNEHLNERHCYLVIKGNEASLGKFQLL